VKDTVPERVGEPVMLIVSVPFPVIVNPVVFVTFDSVSATGDEPPVVVIA
jgi:hypothetical protein